MEIHVTNLAFSASNRELFARIGAHESTALVTVRPDMRSPGWIHEDLLKALGKNPDLSGWGRNDTADALLAPLWCQQSGITDIVVGGCERLSETQVEVIVATALMARARLWLVFEQTGRGSTIEGICGWPVITHTGVEFTSHWQQVTTRSIAAEIDAVETVVSEFPEVPDDDFTTFLAAARRRLEPDAAGLVETRFRQAHLAMKEALSRDVDEDIVTDALRAQLEACSTAAEMVTVARACQVAAFRVGWLVQVDITTLIAQGTHLVAATAENPATYAALNGYRQPYRAASVALCLAGLTPTETAGIKVGDVAAGGDSVNIEGATTALRPEAARFVETSRRHRLIEGAGPDDILIATHKGPAGPRTVGRTLIAAETELGLTLAAGRVDWTPVAPKPWRRRHGIEVVELERRNAVVEQ